MNLINATDIWIQHINLTFTRNNNTKYEGYQINGLKRGTNTKDAYALIVQQLEISDITTENVADSLFDLISRLESTSLSTLTFEFIQSAINNESILSMKLSIDQLNTLKAICEQAQEQYNQDLIQEGIVTNGSQTSQLVLQGLARPTTRTSNSQSQSLEQSIINAVNTALNNKFADLETKLVTEFGLENNKTKNISYDKCEYIELKRILKARDVKLLRQQNNISVVEAHLTNNTAPKSLHIKNFPRPAFEHNSTHVKAHDKAIQSLQVTLLNLSKQTLAQEIIETEQDIKLVKSFLKRKLENDTETFNSLVTAIYKEATDETKDDFIKSMQKVTAMKTNNSDITNTERILLSKLDKPKKSTSISAPTSLNNSSVSTRSVKNNNNTKKSKNNLNNNINNKQHKNKSVSFTPYTKPSNSSVNTNLQHEQNRSNFKRAHLNHVTPSNDFYIHHQRQRPYNNRSTAHTNSNYFNSQNDYSHNYNHRVSYSRPQANYSRPHINQHHSTYNNANNTPSHADHFSTFPDSNFQWAQQNQSRR